LPEEVSLSDILTAIGVMEDIVTGYNYKMLSNLLPVDRKNA
jgi:hypothetical protein